MNIYALIANVLRIVKTHFFACRMVNLSFIETRGIRTNEGSQGSTVSLHFGYMCVCLKGH